MLDAHCHLVSRYFTKLEIDEILQKSSNLEIKLFPVASNLDDFQFLTTGKFDFPFIGIHPVQEGRAVVLKDFQEAKPLMEALLTSRRAFGIGEIGIDYQKHIATSNNIKDEMVQVFRCQLEMAKLHDCFVNVHSRQAGHYAIEILQEMGIENAILHAFDGKPKYALNAIFKHPNYFFSIPGSVQRDEQARKFAAILPLENMLVESDAPALGPVKGQVATPLDIPGTINFIAKLRNIPVEELLLILESNEQRILNGATKNI
jgi:TatD DNase family protein